tara:strand:- start:5112 stop:6416 length:1305 start_codon:yes stop_codon:yes gene_type:complete
MAKPRTNSAGQAVRTEIPDGGCPGLYLVIQPSGRKSWAVRYRRASDGKPRKFTLAGSPSLAIAHKLAREALDTIAEGGDPAAEKVARRRSTPEDEKRDGFGDVAVDFINRYARRKNRSWAGTAWLLGLKPDPENEGELIIRPGGLVEKWSNRRIQDITRRDILELLDGIVDQGNGTQANRTLSALRKMFNWCLERDIVTASPCAAVKPPAPEVSRDRVLNDDELRWLWRACEAYGFPFGPLVKLLLLTGQRRQEVGAMVSGEVDRDARLWTIPAARAKNGIAHDVPLSAQAIEVLDALPKIAGDAGYLFTTNGRAAVSGWSKAKERIDAEMLRAAREEALERGDDPEGVDLPAWTFHDLRRTTASGMARLGINLPVIEKVLNHVSGSFGGIVGVYQRHSFADEKRRALDAWGGFVSRHSSSEEGLNITPLRGIG